MAYVGYSSSDDLDELRSSLSLFLEDRNLKTVSTKESLWVELVNYGYKLGDRILTQTNPELYGSDVEELQELLSRLGFYSEPLNGVFSKEVVSSVIMFQENRGLDIDGTVGLNTVNEIRRIIRPGFNTSLNEALKTISPSFHTGTIGYSVSFVVPNFGDYKDQIAVYEKIKYVCVNKNILASFASEVGEELLEKNIIKYINNKQPVLFVCFKEAEEDSIEYFKGRFSESLLGSDLSQKLGEKLGVKVTGRSSDLLKNTKSVSIIINGKFYQIEKIEQILNLLFEFLNKHFKN